MKTFDILVAGEINPDLILSGDVEPAFGQVEKLVESAVLTIGSSSVITACGAARLGLRVAFIGNGDDVFGRFMLDEMQKRGVDIGNVIVAEGESTGLSVILNRGVDRAILTHPGLIPALSADDIPDSLLRQARHLHVASYFLQDALRPGLPRLFERARALGLTTSTPTTTPPKRGAGCLTCSRSPTSSCPTRPKPVPLPERGMSNERWKSYRRESRGWQSNLGRRARWE